MNRGVFEVRSVEVLVLACRCAPAHASPRLGNAQADRLLVFVSGLSFARLLAYLLPACPPARLRLNSPLYKGQSAPDTHHTHHLHRKHLHRLGSRHCRIYVTLRSS